MDRNEPRSADCPIDGNAVLRDEGPSSWPVHADALDVRFPCALNLSTPFRQPVYIRQLLGGCARERLSH